MPYLNAKLKKNSFGFLLIELGEHLIPNGRVANLLLVELCGFRESLGRGSGASDLLIA